MHEQNMKKFVKTRLFFYRRRNYILKYNSLNYLNFVIFFQKRMTVSLC
jgi:hypothetical protein